MSARCFLVLAMLCAMLFAPLAMTAARAHPSHGGEAVSHCAPDSESENNRHAPDQHARCMIACSAVEADIVTLPRRMASCDAIVRIPAMPSPGGVLLERDTPPPRLP